MAHNEIAPDGSGTYLVVAYSGGNSPIEGWEKHGEDQVAYFVSLPLAEHFIPAQGTE